MGIIHIPERQEGLFLHYGGKFHIFVKIKTKKVMAKYVCQPCGYVYDPAVGDPDSGIAPGTAFEDLPADWTCPICGVGKDMFEPEEA